MNVKKWRGDTSYDLEDRGYRKETGFFSLWFI